MTSVGEEMDRLFIMNSLGQCFSVAAFLVMVSSPGLNAGTCKATTVIGARYPEHARLARIDGSVRVSINLSQDGSVASVRAIEGHAVLSKFVSTAVREWKFDVDKENSSGRCSSLEMQWVFRLNGYCDHAPRCKEGFVFHYPDKVVITSEMPSLQPAIH